MQAGSAAIQVDPDSSSSAQLHFNCSCEFRQKAYLINGGGYELEEGEGDESWLGLCEAEGVKEAGGVAGKGEEAQVGQQDALLQDEVLGGVGQLPVACSQNQHHV